MLSLSVGKGYETAIPIEGTKMAMNYGYDKIRFVSQFRLTQTADITVN